MKLYESGDSSKPVIFLFPGTCCLYSSFDHILDRLRLHSYFYTVTVSYDGFDPNEKTEFYSMEDECEKNEQGGNPWITKQSVYNQFYSDLVTKVQHGIDVPGTTIHVFYATKMGRKYEKRYCTYFKNPDIRRHNMQHEELFCRVGGRSKKGSGRRQTMKEKVNVTGVPETMVQTLYARAKETKKQNAKIKDEIAVELVEKLDYDFSIADKDNAI